MPAFLAASANSCGELKQNFASVNSVLSEEIGVFIRVGIVEVDDNKDSLSIDEGYWE